MKGRCKVRKTLKRKEGKENKKECKKEINKLQENQRRKLGKKNKEV
jgi:hypothetical protein